MSMEVGVMCIAPYSGAESGCHDVPLPSRSIGTSRSVAPFIVIPAMFTLSPCCMFIPGAMDALGVGDAGPMCIPGAMVPAGGDGLGASVMAGIGAIVGAGEGFGAAGAFFAGAGVPIGMPGIGAIVGCAARTGEMVETIKIAATLKRVASKGTSRWAATYYVP